MRKRRWLVLVLCLAVGGACAHAAEWRWQLPAPRYQKINQFERAQYDKAAAAFEARQFKAAASEFEKFRAQYAESAILSNVVLMQGYSLQMAKNRNTAVKVYQEVIDYFPDQTDDVGAAWFLMGQAHLDNGDTLKGMKCFRKMAEDPALKDHPLAAGAIRRLADNCWANKQPDQAVKYWKQVTGYWNTNASEAETAARAVAGYYIITKDYPAYEAWLVNDSNKDKVSHRKWVYELAWNTAWQGFDSRQQNPSRFDAFDGKDKDRTEAMKAFFLWFKTGKPWYEKANETWTFHDRAMTFLTQRWGDKTQRDPEVDDVVAFIKPLKDAAEADQKYARLTDWLRDAGQFDRARWVLAFMQDKLLAAWKEEEILEREDKWKDAVAKLEDLIKSSDPGWQKRAKNELAHVYKDHMGQYEKAIKLYTDINQPPGTLWSIQDAYWRWGKMKEAIAQLTEIENMFPDEAPRAAWQKASYYHMAKDSKNAIAQARRIMKAYPKSQAASQAHQLLEQYGIATGGGVTDQEN